MKKILISAALLSVLVTPALANDCPNQIKKVEEMAVAMPGDKETMDKVAALVTQAKADHEAGKHDESIKASEEAWKLLGM